MKQVKPQSVESRELKEEINRLKQGKEESQRLSKEAKEIVERNEQRNKQLQKRQEDLDREEARLKADRATLDATLASRTHDAEQRAIAAVQKAWEEIAAEMRRLQRQERDLSIQKQEHLHQQKRDVARLENSANAMNEKLRQIATDAKKSQLEEHARILEQRRRSQWQQADDAVEQFHKGALEREQQHRSNYQSYRILWSSFMNPLISRKMQMLQQQDDLHHAAEWWLCSKTDFANARPAGFAHNYPDLDARLNDYFDRESAQAREHLAAMLRHEDSYDENLVRLSGGAHQHRYLTRSLRFESSINSYESALLLEDLTSVGPFTLAAETLLAKRERAKRRLNRLSTVSDGHQTLKADLAAINHEIDFIFEVCSIVTSYKKLVALQTLENESSLEKEMFFTTYDSDAVIATALTQWYAHLRDCKGRKHGVGLPDRNNIGKAESEVKIQLAKTHKAIKEAKYQRLKQLHLQYHSGRRQYPENPEVEARLIEAIREQSRDVETRLRSLMALRRKVVPGRIRVAPSPPPLRIPRTTISPLAQRGERHPTTDKEIQLYKLKRRLRAPPPGYTAEQRTNDRLLLNIWKAEVTAIYRERSSGSKPQAKIPDREASNLKANQDKETAPHEDLAKTREHARVRGGRKRLRRLTFWPTPPLQAVYMAQMPDESTWRPTPAASVLDLRTLSRLANLDLSPNDSSAGALGHTENSLDSNDGGNANDLEVPTAEVDIAVVSDSDSSYQPSRPQPRSQGETTTTDADNDDNIVDREEARGEYATQFAYRISPADYQKAAMASPSTSAAFWSHKLYRNRQGRSPAIHYCTSFDQAEAQAKHFLNEPVVGFDLEWEMGASAEKSRIKRSVSLIQIASEDKIALFQIALYKGETTEELLPPSLRAILESRNIIKAGVNVAGDGSRLQKALGIEVAGLFELSHLYKVVRYSEDSTTNVNKRLCSLADQVQNILLLPLKKDDVRVSAWSQKLRIDQLEYAASDAYAGFQIYYALESRRRRLSPTPPRPALYEDKMPLVLADGRVVNPQPKRLKPKTLSQDGKALEDNDDDEGQEYFDAVETLNELENEPRTTAGVPLSGISIIYPTLPPLEPSSSSRGSRQGPPPSPEITEAESWVLRFRSSLPPEYILRSTHPALRAYALWHKQGLSCYAVAALLRGPPLKVQTVAGYVLQAVKEEDLKYDVERVREVFEVLPKSAHGRFSKVLRQIGGL